MKLSMAFGAGIVVGAAGLAGGLVIAGPGMDPVKAHPEYYTVRIDNEWVRVLEYRLKPGQKEPMHSHPHGFVYMLADARARVTPADGNSSVIEDHAGDLIWRGPTTHAYENVGNTDVHAIGVELKPCARQ
jgi:quercetin dioxygenase-like cupin family protein